jgi:hypothetical protein
MTLLAAWALGGLVLLVPLVIAHLRREHRPLYDVPSLLLWQEPEQRASAQARRLRLPRLPLLLALQALALVLLVVALARPAAPAARARPAHVYVLDDSVWMSADGRLADAERRLEALAATLPRGTPVRIVLADGAPRVLYRGPAAAGVAVALRRVAPSAAPSTLAEALTVAAGLLAGPRDEMVLLRAPEDAAPTPHARAGQFAALVIGAPVAEQGIFSPSSRCGIGASGACEVLAVVGNSAAAAVRDRYTAAVNGRPALSGSVRVGAHSTADIVLSARPDEQVSLRLDSRAVLPGAGAAWVTVPSLADGPSASTVTVVGTPSDATPVARAFAAVPGVTLRLSTPATYDAVDARTSDLTVLDGWLPRGGLPASPSVLLIDPPSVPGGRVGGNLSDSTPSGTDAGSELLTGVDLGSLKIDPGAGRTLVLPPYLTPVAWSPGGVLLGAGDDGSRRLAVLAFDPSQSDLPQLASFPVLAANLVRWAAGWAPDGVAAGEPWRVDATPGARHLTLARAGDTVASAPLHGHAVAFTVSRAGLYTVRETGDGVDREATVAVSASAPLSAPAPSAPLDLAATSAGSPPGNGPTRAPWFLAAALVVLVLEWTYWRMRAPRLRVR